ncbi:MAG: hypothetical protein M1812_001249 [Candelaria pacifica]|nr:MAG: hypothetical protein M1812_001249 [Candelaria pacifica]
MDERDVMALDPVNPPDSPGDTPRETPSKPCGPQSMEDPDNSLKRKRPRLDSGDRNSGNMLTERTVAASSSSEPAPTSHESALTEQGLEQTHQQTEVHSPTHVRTPSKVTINVRAPQPDNLELGQDPKELLSAHSGRSDMAAAQDSSSSSLVTANQTATVSASSSQPRSPEIEVAEVEDIDSADDGSEWPYVVNVIGEEGQGANLMERFPYLDRGQTLMDTMHWLAGLLEKGDLGHGEIILELTSWFNAYLNYTERPVSRLKLLEDYLPFWMELPHIFESFLRRRHPFGPNFHVYPPTISDGNCLRLIEDLFKAFARLTLRLVQMDIHILEQSSPADNSRIEFYSHRYAQALNWITRTTEIPLWTVFTKHYNISPSRIVVAVAESLLATPMNGFSYLSQFAALLFKYISNRPILMQHAYPAMYIAKNILLIASSKRSACKGDILSIPERWRNFPRETIGFFRAMDAEIQVSIPRVPSSLSADFSKELINTMTGLLSDSAHADRTLAASLFNEIVGPFDDAGPEDFADLMGIAWKFKLLKKYVTEGRMELRVQGLETLQLDLVTAWNKYAKSNEVGINHPVMQYLASFILENKLVDYIVGIDSHPQLIARSGNIVGFLVVNFKYTSHESDAIWHTVATSQDPRVVAAILTMLESILNTCEYGVLIYLCKKLNELPLHAFDAKMIDYGVRLLQHIRDKFSNARRDEQLATPPYDLCIRLIRQAAADGGQQTANVDAVSQFALSELAQLLQWGPSENDRRLIYKECIRDIAEKSPNATGSICAINALLSQRPHNDTAMLTDELDLARLVVDELALSVERQRQKNVPSLGRNYAVSARLDLLYNIILYEPETIKPELGDVMWDSLWGQGALGEREREIAWSKLINALDALERPNDFLNRCITLYLPQLDPSLFTHGVLTFSQHVIDIQNRSVVPRADAGHEVIEIIGVEQVWRLILTAPSDSIGVSAIKLLVGIYLDSSLIANASALAVDATHIAVVERCVQQLTSAASKLRAFSDGTTSGEDEPMVIVVSDAEIFAQELRFHRSLSFLKEIIFGMRARPQYSPPLKQAAEISQLSTAIKGEPIRIHYQAFTGNSQTAIRDFEIGDLETANDLNERLRDITKFPHFKIIAGGQYLKLDGVESQSLREMRIANKGLLMIRKVEAANEAPELGCSEGVTAVELEISKHFDDLYDLLGLEEKLAQQASFLHWTPDLRLTVQQIFEFIISFSPEHKIRKMVVDDTTSTSTIFPAGQPYKALYCISTLQTCLKEQLQRGNENEQFISHGVRLMLSAVMDTSIIEAASNHQLKVSIAARIVECLLAFLKEPVRPEIAASYFTNETALVSRLMTMLRAAISTSTDQGFNSTNLARQCFATIVEASLHSDVIWKVFTERSDVKEILSSVLTMDGRIDLRRGVADTILGVCASVPRATRVPAAGFASYFWRILSDILPETLHYRAYSREFFELSLSVFRYLGELSTESLDLNSCIRNWGNLLLNCGHEEYIGRESEDHFISGLTNLLRWAVQLAKSSKKPLRLGNLLEKVFSTHLFPDLSPFTTSSSITPLVPAVQSQTRQALYSLILSLIQDEESYQTTLGLVSELVPEGACSPDRSWGISNASKDYEYGAVWNVDRSKIIRSPTGYAGLRNLSNTCYLNSLFTQLFMNVGFRKFMLDANIADGDGSQKLLSETKKLFAHMQDSWQKMVDPKDLADSIRTYENEQIDVTIQMDVDEFYNLLFDRWEGQILSSEAKQTFRSFYGGQLVQQVKSKECPHVSEREEPFSAVQCDIKGKATLQDSLKAYVEGEIMEGDNKYSCTSCGRHVDAVKRTCLKDVPDNLMFHLKRFDFDLVTMQRSKINDFFEFPNEIDMKPYKIDHLSDPESETSEDLFRLVGVLVHSGTAESGHYYSYIKERPVANSHRNAWVEFNDADVSEFDPGKIPEQCFGGLNESTPGLHQLRFPKVWNAYMLFYQRCSILNEEEKAALSVQSVYPVKLPVPMEIGNYIALENELFMRNYCLFDPVHPPFVQSLVEQLRHLNKGLCSEDHGVEQAAISLALEHVNQILSRTKDVPDFDGMMGHLMRIIGSCAECCKLALDWVVAHPSATRNLLLKHPSQKVREEFTKMIISALGYLRRMDPQLYGHEIIETDLPVAEWTSSDGAFQQVLNILLQQWTIIDANIRSWEDYFGLLAQMAALGIAEAAAILCAGLLHKCLELLTVEGGQRPNNQVRLLRLLEKGRKPNYTQLIRLVRDLLVRIDLRDRPVTDEEERATLPINEKSPLTDSESSQFRMLHPKTRNLVFLSKMIDCTHNVVASSDIIKMLLQAEPEINLLPAIYQTILSGISIDPASMAVPYLTAAHVFCEYSPRAAEARDMVARTARDVETIDVQGGHENLQFFYSLLTTRNDHVNSDPLGYRYLVLENIQFWAPPLLLYWEEKVRSDTATVLKGLIFDYGFPIATENPRLSTSIEKAAKLLGKSCMKQLQVKYLAARVTVEARTVTEIVDTIRKCMEYFNADASEEGRDLSACQVALQQLDALIVDEVDDAVSEWDNDDSNAASESDVDADGI